MREKCFFRPALPLMHVYDIRCKSREPGLLAAYLYVGQSGPGVMAEPAHLLARVPVVIRVAAVRRTKTEISALLHTFHLLVYRVHGLQYPARQLLELTQLDGLFDTVVLEVVVPWCGIEGSCPCHR